MIQIFKLPDLGEGLVEAEIVQWAVSVGDSVSLNQTIAEVETAKATVELPSPFTGIVRELHARPGDTIPVGTPLIGIDTGEPELWDDVPPPNLVGYGAPHVGSGDRPVRRLRIDSTAPSIAPNRQQPSSVAAYDREPAASPASPLVRRVARELGIDLALVTPTGVGGRVTRADLDSYVNETTGSSASSESKDVPADYEDGTQASLREQRVPVRGVRKQVSEAMVRSAFTAPHAAVFLTVDVTATMAFIRSIQTHPLLVDHRMGILPVVAKVVCLALGHTPELRSRWDDDAHEIVQFNYVNLGIAAATSRGLLVPNIRNAHELSLVELTREIANLTTNVRAGKSAPKDMIGGTFTLTNIGVFGVDAGTPILNPGEAGILALGTVRRRPWELDGEVVVRDVLTLSLSFDHRLVDGAQAATFLHAVGAMLTAPELTMLYKFPTHGKDIDVLTDV